MTARDPVCGAEVDTLRARAVAIVDGTTYYFCSAAHKEQFLRGSIPAPAPAPAPAPVRAPVPVPAPAPDATPDAVAETAPIPDEKPIARRASPLRYVFVVLILFAGAVTVALLSRR